MESEFNTILEARIEEGGEKTTALVDALTEKTNLQAKIEELNLEREELETEFNLVLDSKIKEHSEAISEQNEKIVKAL